MRCRLQLSGERSAVARGTLWRVSQCALVGPQINQDVRVYLKGSYLHLLPLTALPCHQASVSDSAWGRGMRVMITIQDLGADHLTLDAGCLEKCQLQPLVSLGSSRTLRNLSLPSENQEITVNSWPGSPKFLESFPKQTSQLPNYRCGTFVLVQHDAVHSISLAFIRIPQRAC